ncbi:MAG TPA: hypothetical protein VME68_02850 [Acidobacteriaceae bacterium]|nr:hypothetical protein [Acidobacteriaceae bacterium]
MKRFLWAAAASMELTLLAGCAMTSNPQPPTLWLPEPVRDLTGARAGNQVHLRWTMPKNTTDKVPLKGDQAAHFCWTSGIAPEPAKPAPLAVPSTGLPGCTALADAMFPPDKPAETDLTLPAALTSGTPRAVSVFVELRNHAGKTAGPSNPLWIAAGQGPPPVTGLTVSAQAGGLVLHWQPAAEPGAILRIHRTLVVRPGAPKPSESAGVPTPQEQTLEVDLGARDPGLAIDRDAALDHTYRYTAERVRRVDVGHHTLEIAGSPSQPVTIDAKDVFPPAVPSSLAVVADEQGRALDLSWSPDTDPDLAGYVVYRRDGTAGAGPERISGPALVVPPSFEDKTVVPGHRYAYSVSAVDQDGNESARSGEVEEELPQ